MFSAVHCSYNAAQYLKAISCDLDIEWVTIWITFGDWIYIYKYVYEDRYLPVYHSKIGNLQIHYHQKPLTFSTWRIVLNRT